MGDVIPVEHDGGGLRVHRLEPGGVLTTIAEDGRWAVTLARACVLPA